MMVAYPVFNMILHSINMSLSFVQWDKHESLLITYTTLSSRITHCSFYHSTLLTHPQKCVVGVSSWLQWDCHCEKNWKPCSSMFKNIQVWTTRSQLHVSVVHDFKDDDAHHHRAMIVEDFHDRHMDYTHMQWPVCIPDMNPIEHASEGLLDRSHINQDEVLKWELQIPVAPDSAS